MVGNAMRHAQLTPLVAARITIVLVVFLLALTTVQSTFNKPSSAAVTKPVGMYTGRETPGAEHDPNAVELGTRFVVTVPGSIVAVRYYKAAGNTGRHTGTVWSPRGAVLAMVTFRPGARLGWQTATLSKPVHVKPGHTYLVSYHTNTGYYSQRQYAFANHRTLGASYIRGVAGVYRYGAHRRPTASWHRSAYYVDALFRAGSGTTSGNRSVSPSPTRVAVPAAGFPDASDSGVLGGTKFVGVPAEETSGTGWSWVGGVESCIHVTGDGAVLSRLAVAGCIEIYADNVTISDVDIKVDGDGEGWGIGVRGKVGATIEDTTIAPATPGHQLQVGIKDLTGSSTLTILRNDISGWSTGIQVSRGLVEDNYVHDPVYRAGDHTNGFTDDGGRYDGTMIVRHNTFLNTQDQADAISFFEDFGYVQNVVVENNLIAGGSYSLYAGHNDGGPATNHIVITGNHFSTRYFSLGGTFGPACCFDHGVGNVWSGNVWQDGAHAGQPVHAPYND